MAALESAVIELPLQRSRRSRHRRWAVAIAVLLLSAAPTLPDTTDVTVTVSGNVRHLARVDIPGAVGISFSSRRPVAYVTARDGAETRGKLVTLDISDPRNPQILAEIPVPSSAYLEDHDQGERPDGTTFVLMREDTDAGTGLRIVDVTDPRNPRKRGFLLGASPHTWTCVDPACYHAYGNADGSVSEFAGPFAFLIVDLQNLDAPFVQTTVGSPGGFHDWNRDDAGILWGVGRDGIAAWAVADPSVPALLNTSDAHGPWSPLNPLNDRLHLHGSLRPNARGFVPDEDASTASVARGNVLLVSEEGDNLECTDSFQTWFVPHLEPAMPGTNDLAQGSISPLDSWSLLETDPLTRGAPNVWCSVHWFDYHQGGFVVLPAYGSGTRILDVRDARDIKEIGYHWEAGALAMQSYWVPERRPGGRATGRATNIVFTADAGHPPTSGVTGGVDVFEVSLPCGSAHVQAGATGLPC